MESVMKKLNILPILIFILMGLTAYQAEACHVDFKVLEGEKTKYCAGDKLTVEVHVVYTHKRCPISIDDTKFKMSGIKVVGSTKWKTTNNRSYTRKLKLVVKGKKKANATLTAVRTCDLEGGFGEMKLPLK